MADKYYTFEEAVELMKKGYVMSPNLGSYDYYILKETITYDENKTALILYGYDMDELFAIQEDELAIVSKTEWYIISKPKEEK
jgi:hypothetical protein